MDKLKYADLVTTLPFRIETYHMDNIKTLAAIQAGTDGHDHTIDYDVYLPSIGMNLQRDFCWTDLQKSEFILSILKGTKILPLAEIYHIHADGRATTHHIIDGKQRLSTLLDFVNGKEGLFLIYNNCAYTFTDLDEDAQRQILLYRFEVNRAWEYDDSPISDTHKIAWFEKLNFSGTQQDKGHLDKLKAKL